MPVNGRLSTTFFAVASSSPSFASCSGVAVLRSMASGATAFLAAFFAASSAACLAALSVASVPTPGLYRNPSIISEAARGQEGDQARRKGEVPSVRFRDGRYRIFRRRVGNRRTLLGPQRIERRDRARSNGWHERSDQRRHSKRDDGCQDHREIVLRRAVELGAQKSSCGQRQRQPDQQSNENQPECASNDQPDHVSPIGAQRHPQADLADAASGIVWRHSVQPNRRQEQREDPEQRRQARDESLLDECPVIPAALNRRRRPESNRPAR